MIDYKTNLPLGHWQAPPGTSGDPGSLVPSPQSSSPFVTSTSEQDLSRNVSFWNSTQNMINQKRHFSDTLTNTMHEPTTGIGIEDNAYTWQVYMNEGILVVLEFVFASPFSCLYSMRIVFVLGGVLSWSKKCQNGHICPIFSQLQPQTWKHWSCPPQTSKYRYMTVI